MALAFEVDALDGLDEPTQKLYTKTDAGKFRLQVTGVEPPEQVAGLKTKNAELLKEKKEAETKAAAAALKADEDA